jgi:transposase-like protein
MAVKASLTYTIDEAAQALGKNPATIRNWIRDGLPVMSSCKPYLMSGAAIREYLRAKHKAAKRPLEADQLFCPTCGVGRKPVDMAVCMSKIAPKTNLLKGQCSQCKGTATRMIARSRVTEFAQTFIIKKQATSGT